ncbi:hypothetical protein ACQRIU_005133 [Beauveria bassiana]
MAEHTDSVVANLVVIIYDRLQRRDADEAARLHLACVEWGFFYLDLGDGGREMLKTVDELLPIAREYFAKPFEEKLKDTHENEDIFHICGYKPLGLDQGNVKNQKDGCEGLRLPLDLQNRLADGRMSIPQGIENSWSTVAKFMVEGSAVCNLVLESLSTSMGLQGEERLEAQHRDKSPSTSTAVLQCYPAVQDLPPNTSQGHFAHTDAGSISMLFASEWGLQVHSPRHARWEYVTPRPGCVVVNVGDSLRFLSEFRLRSSLHRVVPHRERWHANTRYSVLFFLRPNNDASFTDSEGVSWKAVDWLGRKFGNYRRSHREQKESAMSTGRKGLMGLWEDS